ncbi:MAG: hypothetical protein IPM84_09295 [Anaerolineae bacterium]|nr:hypothetical protein [Anaerolineae bacterium]
MQPPGGIGEPGQTGLDLLSGEVGGFGALLDLAPGRNSVIPPQVEQTPVAADEVIVRFREGMSADAVAAILAEQQAQVVREIKPLNALVLRSQPGQALALIRAAPARMCATPSRTPWRRSPWCPPTPTTATSARSTRRR